jgi:hypothetical protein
MNMDKLSKLLLHSDNWTRDDYTGDLKHSSGISVGRWDFSNEYFVEIPVGKSDELFIIDAPRSVRKAAIKKRSLLYTQEQVHKIEASLSAPRTQRKHR